MGDQHLKGAASTIEGTAKDGAGKLTGDKSLEAKGKARKVQGKVQDRLGDTQGRSRLQVMVMSAAGVVGVLLMAGLLTGMVRMARA